MLAQKISGAEQLRVLALRLGVPPYRIDAHLHNYRLDISMAAFGTLHEWTRDQSDKKQAYQRLRQALEEANMASLIENLM